MFKMNASGISFLFRSVPFFPFIHFYPVNFHFNGEVFRADLSYPITFYLHIG